MDLRWLFLLLLASVFPCPCLGSDHYGQYIATVLGILETGFRHYDLIIDAYEAGKKSVFGQELSLTASPMILPEINVDTLPRLDMPSNFLRFPLSLSNAVFYDHHNFSIGQPIDFTLGWSEVLDKENPVVHLPQTPSPVETAPNLLQTILSHVKILLLSLIQTPGLMSTIYRLVRRRARRFVNVPRFPLLHLASQCLLSLCRIMVLTVFILFHLANLICGTAWLVLSFAGLQMFRLYEALIHRLERDTLLTKLLKRSIRRAQRKEFVYRHGIRQLRIRKRQMQRTRNLVFIMMMKEEQMRTALKVLESKANDAFAIKDSVDLSMEGLESSVVDARNLHARAEGYAMKLKQYQDAASSAAASLNGLQSMHDRINSVTVKGDLHSIKERTSVINKANENALEALAMLANNNQHLPRHDNALTAQPQVHESRLNHRLDKSVYNHGFDLNDQEAEHVWNDEASVTLKLETEVAIQEARNSSIELEAHNDQHTARSDATSQTPVLDGQLASIPSTITLSANQATVTPKFRDIRGHMALKDHDPFFLSPGGQAPRSAFEKSLQLPSDTPSGPSLSGPVSSKALPTLTLLSLTFDDEDVKSVSALPAHVSIETLLSPTDVSTPPNDESFVPALPDPVSFEAFPSLTSFDYVFGDEPSAPPLPDAVSSRPLPSSTSFDAVVDDDATSLPEYESDFEIQVEEETAVQERHNTAPSVPPLSDAAPSQPLPRSESFDSLFDGDVTSLSDYESDFEIQVDDNTANQEEPRKTPLINRSEPAASANETPVESEVPQTSLKIIDDVSKPNVDVPGFPEKQQEQLRNTKVAHDGVKEVSTDLEMRDTVFGQLELDSRQTGSEQAQNVDTDDLEMADGAAGVEGLRNISERHLGDHTQHTEEQQPDTNMSEAPASQAAVQTPVVIQSQPPPARELTAEEKKEERLVKLLYVANPLADTKGTRQAFSNIPHYPMLDEEMDDAPLPPLNKQPALVLEEDEMKIEPSIQEPITEVHDHGSAVQAPPPPSKNAVSFTFKTKNLPVPPTKRQPPIVFQKHLKKGPPTFSEIWDELDNKYGSAEQTPPPPSKTPIPSTSKSKEPPATPFQKQPEVVVQKHLTKVVPAFSDIYAELENRYGSDEQAPPPPSKTPIFSTSHGKSPPGSIDNHAVGVPPQTNKQPVFVFEKRATKKQQDVTDMLAEIRARETGVRVPPPASTDPTTSNLKSKKQGGSVDRQAAGFPISISANPFPSSNSGHLPSTVVPSTVELPSPTWKNPFSSVYKSQQPPAWVDKPTVGVPRPTLARPFSSISTGQKPSSPVNPQSFSNVLYDDFYNPQPEPADADTQVILESPAATILNPDSDVEDDAVERTRPKKNLPISDSIAGRVKAQPKSRLKKAVS